MSFLTTVADRNCYKFNKKMLLSYVFLAENQNVRQS